MYTVIEPFSLILVSGGAVVSAIITILALALSQIRFDVLTDIVRKTCASVIIIGLVLTMAEFSRVLAFFDDTFTTFQDDQWHCFAVITPIGFSVSLPPTLSNGSSPCSSVSMVSSAVAMAR